MEYYCTYCCREKIRTGEKIRAIDLYLSKRIKKVYQLAQKHNKKFIILSGKYGFLTPEEEIFYYDKLLKKTEVETLSYKLAQFIKTNKITKIVFFHRPEESDKNIINYLKAAESACEKSKINFETKIYKKKNG